MKLIFKINEDKIQLPLYNESISIVMCTNPKIHDIYKFEHLDVQLITDDKHNLGSLNYQLCLNKKTNIQKKFRS